MLASFPGILEAGCSLCNFVRGGADRWRRSGPRCLFSNCLSAIQRSAGPGWFAPHLPTLSETSFFASWAFFSVGPFAIVWGCVMWLLPSCSHGWTLLRLLGGLIIGLLSLLGVGAAGWYIAISAVPVLQPAFSVCCLHNHGGAGRNCLNGLGQTPCAAKDTAKISSDDRKEAVISK